MPIRLRSALTTLATALTIPVNIHVSREEQVVPKPDVIQVAELRGFGQAFHACSTQGSGGIPAADQTGRDVRVDLVHQAFGEERGMDLGAALDEQAEQAAVAELVEERGQRDSAVRGGGQAKDLGRSHAALR